MKLLWIILPLLALAQLSGCAVAPADHNGADAPRTAAIVPLKAERPVIGLVFGAWGARGFAHVGVVKALEAAGIEADVVVGTSSGALVASFYAGGMKAAALENMALALEDKDIFDFTLFGPGRVRGARLQHFVNDTLNRRKIEALAKPFAAVAAEHGSGRMAVFNRGNTGLAVRASAAVPSLFWPVTINGRSYVDGGVASRVPAALARDMGADVVIAVDISRRPASDADAADVVVRPQTTRSRINDFQHRRANIDAGEAATFAVIGEIRDSLAKAHAHKARAAHVTHGMHAASDHARARSSASIAAARSGWLK